MYYRSTDTNQNDIVKALRKIPGVKVYTGVDDILVGYKSVTRWYEVKNPAEIAKGTGRPFKRTKKGSSTYMRQQALKGGWTGHYRIIWTLEQILEELGII